MHTTKESTLSKTQSTVVGQTQGTKKTSNTSTNNFDNKEQGWKTVKRQSYGWSRWNKWNWEDRVVESRRYTKHTTTTQSQASSSNKTKLAKSLNSASKPAILAGANKDASDQKYYLSIPSAHEQLAPQKTSSQTTIALVHQEEQILCGKEQISSEWGKPLRKVANSDASTNTDEATSVRSAATQIVRATPTAAAVVQVKNVNENNKTKKKEKGAVKQVKSQPYGWSRWGKWNYEDRIAREDEYWNQKFENRVSAK